MKNLNLLGGGELRGNKISYFDKSPRINKKKAFSIAEALITLAIVGITIGSAAPLISKTMKNSQVGNFQMMQINKTLDTTKSDINNLRNQINLIRTSLANYVTKTELTTTLSKYVKITDLTTKLSSYITSDQLNSRNYITSESLTGFLTDSDLTALRNRLTALEQTPAPTNDNFPIGGIIMWSGTTIPTGWKLCNGQNGTPDLRDRFIVGAGSSYAIGAKGGASTVTLTASQIPPHRHLVHEYAGPVHTDKTNHRAHVNAGTNGGSSSYTGSIGGGQAHENRPPYYALAYIMKVSN
ncbi:hypothetical protein IJE86_02520 [bacterium]|nr:hypothetical protein [bacterium]